MTEKILLIESDADVAGKVETLLREAGYSVLHVVTKEAGRTQMREWHPDMVLISDALPEGAGQDLFSEKFADKTLASIPTMLLAHSGKTEDINRALSLGVKDYALIDGLNPAEVVAKVSAQLGGMTGALDSISRPTGATGLKGRTIMWVEDDKFLSDIIGRRLKAQECNLIHSINAEEALRDLQKNTPDLLLLDILLPGIDGFEILKRVKENPRTKNIPVILLSNLGQKEDIEKGRALGAARFLIKATVTLDEIVEEIKVVLKESGK
ncbi:MAG: response regulator [bacterium]|nr:response regulator [bacterium]